MERSANFSRIGIPPSPHVLLIANFERVQRKDDQALNNLLDYPHIIGLNREGKGLFTLFEFHYDSQASPRYLYARYTSRRYRIYFLLAGHKFHSGHRKFRETGYKHSFR